MKQLGLIGYPLSHSFSKKYFEDKFQHLALTDYSYEVFPLEKIEELTVLLNQRAQLIGLNVTIPYKEQVIPFLDQLDETAKAVEFVLKQIGVECWFMSRDKTESKKPNCLNYDELNQYVVQAFKLIVNTSPVGMYPNTANCPLIPYQYIAPGHLLYDLVYNPEETLFMKKGKEQGAVAVNGLSMLYHQADKAWEIWNE